MAKLPAIIKEQIELDSDERATLSLVADYSNTRNKKIKSDLRQYIEDKNEDISSRARRIGLAMLRIEVPGISKAESAVAKWYREIARQEQNNVKILRESWKRKCNLGEN